MDTSSSQQPDNESDIDFQFACHENESGGDGVYKDCTLRYCE